MYTIYLLIVNKFSKT